MNLIKSNQKRNILVIIRCFIHTYETYYQELFNLLQDFLKKSPFRERKTIDERIFEKLSFDDTINQSIFIFIKAISKLNHIKIQKEEFYLGFNLKKLMILKLIIIKI